MNILQQNDHSSYQLSIPALYAQAQKLNPSSKLKRKSSDQAIRDCMISELRSKFSVKIIKSPKFPDKEKAVLEVRKIGDEGDLRDPEKYLLKGMRGGTEYLTYFAIKNDTIVGYLSGQIQANCFFVHRLAVQKDFRRNKSHLLNEKVGTRLMLRALKKTKKLGLDILCLQFDAGGGEILEVDEEKCRTRINFYQHFERYDIKFSFIDESNEDDVIIRTMTYYVKEFQYDKVLKML